MSPTGVRLLDLSDESNARSSSSSPSHTNTNLNKTCSSSSSDKPSPYFFTQGVIQTSGKVNHSNPRVPISVNYTESNRNFADSNVETGKSFNFFLKPKYPVSPEVTSPADCSNNVSSKDSNYLKNWNIFPAINKLVDNSERESHPLFYKGSSYLKTCKDGLYEQLCTFGKEVSSWKKNLVRSQLWSTLLSYPSDLHWNGRVFLITAVTGMVIGRKLEDLLETVDLTQLENFVLDYNFLDGSDPNDPGRVGVNKDFL